MKVLFCSRSTAQFPYHVSIIEALLRDGHTVKLLYDEIWSERSLFDSPALNEFALRQPNVTLGWSQRRVGSLRRIVFILREFRSVASYLTRPSQSRFYLDRWINYLPTRLHSFARSRHGSRLLKSRLVRGALAQIESAVPADRSIKSEIASFAPDVVVCSPANMRRSEEVEYLKAAKWLNIPTALPVYSWDNLSTKGVIHVPPDLLLAWNNVHEQEAIEIHGIDSRRVVQTGSPLFDKWFSMRQRGAGRHEFMAKVGLDPARPYVLYLGSSSNIARDESWVVAELAEHFGNDPVLHGMQILVRPHPAHNEVYEKVLRENVSMWPRKKQLPDDPESQIDFVDSVRHALLSIGVNTTGMIDALIQDHPVAAFVSNTFKATQEQAVHFQHMRKARCLYEVNSCAEVLCLVKSIREGEPRDLCERRRAFVRAMVRPHGLDQDAGQLSAWCIEKLAEGVKPETVKTLLPHFVRESCKVDAAQ
jgi:hypothetical protein